MEYGCIGERLGHSFSKIIHNELADYDYTLCEIAKEDLTEFMTKADFKAINVTIPYKRAVIPFLYEIDEKARKIGAVNTVVKKDDRLYGYNTDFYGMAALINREGISLCGKKVLVLGSGGTSKTACAVAESMNALSIYVVSRKKQETNITYEEAYENHLDAQIVINTTPCGMYPNIDNVALDISLFKNLEAVIDAVYNPIDSLLVTSAKIRGIKAVGGLYMLISQAAFAVEKFIDCKISSNVVDDIYRKLILNKKNLVLIGMPSCGKSTIGKAVALELNKEFIDTDEEIVKKAGITIPQIFEKYGEEYFRDLESEVIAEISLKQNCVVATGGGAILRSKNVKLLKGNGIILFIDRSPQNLLCTDDRPLSQNRELLMKRYEERYDLYNSVSHIKINADNDIQTNIKLAKEGFLNEIFSY